MNEILVIDDDLEPFKPGLLQALRGHPLRFAASGQEGLDALGKYPNIGLVLLDICMPAQFSQDSEREGLEVLKQIRKQFPEVPVIMLTVLNDVDLVVEAIQAGAFHYILKPIDRDKLRDAVRHALENTSLKHRVQEMNHAREVLLRVHSGTAAPRKTFHGMVGSHPMMQDLYAKIERLAQYDDVKVLVLGESGSGKELVARALHECSARPQKPFVAINCASIAESVLESELFGHEKGAFTGADTTHKGLFQRAEGGTLFLDEIGEMSMPLQAKLLRAIENREITPVGGTPVKVDVRIICATNRDLTAAKDSGAFRADLYYRICDVPLTVPPLRDRKSDIPALADHFLKLSVEKNKVRRIFTTEALYELCQHDWPGNVREMAAVIRRLVIFSTGDTVEGEQVKRVLSGAPEESLSGEISSEEVELPPELLSDPVVTVKEIATSDPPQDQALPRIDDMTEYCRIHGEMKLKETIVNALKQGGNARAAMTLLGIPEDRYDAFRKWLQRLGIKVRGQNG